MNYKTPILEKIKSNTEVVGIIGLGYVGLPLAVEFAKKFPVVGFDINQNRVNELISGHDSTLEVEDNNLQSVLFTTDNNDNIDNHDKNESHPTTGLSLTTNSDDLADCSYYIITVPTPTDKNNRPVLTPLIKPS